MFPRSLWQLKERCCHHCWARLSKEKGEWNEERESANGFKGLVARNIQKEWQMEKELYLVDVVVGWGLT
jgi:hypothetical protein